MLFNKGDICEVIEITDPMDGFKVGDIVVVLENDNVPYCCDIKAYMHDITKVDNVYDFIRAADEESIHALCDYQLKLLMPN